MAALPFSFRLGCSFKIIELSIKLSEGLQEDLVVIFSNLLTCYTMAFYGQKAYSQTISYIGKVSPYVIRRLHHRNALSQDKFAHRNRSGLIH